MHKYLVVQTYFGSREQDIDIVEAENEEKLLEDLDRNDAGLTAIPLEKVIECLRKNRCVNGSNAFVVYGSLGQPLAYFFKSGSDEFTEEEMTAIMKLFPEAKDNAETCIVWREDV